MGKDQTESSNEQNTTKAVETTEINNDKETHDTEHEVVEDHHADDIELSRWGIIARYTAIMMRKSNILMTSFRLYGRPMAYASEFGESFRPFVNPLFVNTMYGVSIFYVAADVGISCYNIREHGRESQLYTALDQTLWHSMASLALPAVTIHQIVHLSQHHAAPRIAKYAPRLGRFSPILFGLGSIPFIIHPLDHIADFIMNNTLRKFWYGDKISIEHH